MLHASGDPAAASSSTIAELQNPEINPFLTYNLFVVCSESFNAPSANGAMRESVPTSSHGTTSPKREKEREREREKERERAERNEGSSSPTTQQQILSASTSSLSLSNSLVGMASQTQIVTRMS